MRHEELRGCVMVNAMRWLTAGMVVLSSACAARGGGGDGAGVSPGDAVVAARSHRVSATDSALVGRILLAEDRRDSTDRAIAEGRAHADPVIRMLATRALGRIRDPRFAARDSLRPLPAPPVWPEPDWKV